MKQDVGPFAQYLDEITENGCWVTWLAPNGSGYGAIWTQPIDGPRRKVGLHVAAYEHFIGPVPAGLVLDHVECNNRLCFNPAHVVPTTQRKNVIRAAELYTSQNDFPCGHARSAENSVRNGRSCCGSVVYRCRTCNKARLEQVRARGAAA